METDPKKVKETAELEKAVKADPEKVKETTEPPKANTTEPPAAMGNQKLYRLFSTDSKRSSSSEKKRAIDETE